MTREERLNLLKQIEKDIYVCSLESTFLDDAKSCAIHSVIEELEQEPCDDCISRAEAIKTIQRYGIGSQDFEDYTPEQAERFVIQKLSELHSVGKDMNIPTTDCVSREALDRGLYERFHEEGNTITTIPLGAVRNFIKEFPSVKPVTQWHRIKTRPLTDEEKDKMCLNDNYYTFMYDCEMPDDEQEVLIKTKWGIEKTTYHTDDGCYFEDYEDEDDVIAWTELPEWDE